MKFFLALLLGVVVGGALVYFLFVGAPGTKRTVPGEAVRAPEPSGPPPGTAIVELDEPFFNALLGKIFSDLGPPTFRLAGGGPSLSVPHEQSATEFAYVRAQEGGCQNQVVLAPEGSGVRTGVRLENAQVLAPLAFSGTYNIPLLGCQNFRGTAEANIALRFDAPAQTLFGQLNVAAVNLEGMSPLLSGPVTNFVQNSINQRVNPLVLMRGQQISLSIPVQATGGTLGAQAADIRSEVKDKKLRLHITYDFKGAKGAASPPPPS
ncbi:MAG: hypothetical protein H0T60_11875 [Acidobacteria bacterium]|nr:hypothetical protein [Acidobacteriota bacterium]